MDQEKTFYLPRLPREYYQGDAVVHWSLPTFDRASGWLSEKFEIQFRELMLHAQAREGLLCPIYCLMPDHIHFVWMGLRLESDQINGMSFLRTYLGPKLAPAKFQSQAHDNVLRQEERKHNAFAKACHYIAENPLRAELVADPKEWRHTNSVIPGYPELNPLSEDFWPIFWKLHGTMRHADAGNIIRPPF